MWAFARWRGEVMHIVIAGSGIAGITLAETLRKLAPAFSVTVVTRETHGYYSRPMLSHGFSREDVESRIIVKDFAALRETGIRLCQGIDVLALQPDAKTLTVQAAAAGTETLSYDRLVLATGSEAVVPAAFRPEKGTVRVVNSLDDLIGLRRLRQQILAAGRTPRWALIGGGLIGCEVAADLARVGDSVVLYHARTRLMERQLSEADSSRLLTVLTGQGITVCLPVAVAGVDCGDQGYAVQRDTGTETGFDGVIVACGFRPRIELAVQAGLSTGRGIRVDDFLTTSDPAIHAIGDVAECADGSLYAYVMPVRHQALWLAGYLAGTVTAPWQVPAFKPRAKVHGFEPA